MSELRPEKLLNFSFRSKLQVILQTEASECALACIAMIANYHGYRTTLSSLRSKYSISSKGATLSQIRNIANNIRLSSRPLRLDLEQLNHLETPCILHWDMNHFVVLTSVAKKGIEINDPSVGKRKLSWKEVSKSFTGIALELKPNSSFKKDKRSRKLKFSDLAKNFIGLKRSLGNILVVSLILQFLSLMSPYYMQIVVDDVLVQGNLSFLTVLSLGFILVILMEVLFRIVREYWLINLSNKLSVQLSSNIFNHLVRLPMSYFISRHVGDIVSRFNSSKSIQQLFSSGIVTAIIDGLMAIVTLVVISLYSLKLTLIVVSFVILYAALRYAFYFPLRRLTEEGVVTEAKVNSHFIETARSVQTIKLLQLEDQRQSHWQNSYVDNLNVGIKNSMWGLAFSSLKTLAFGVENILVIYIATTYIFDNVMTVGMLYAFVSYKTRFSSAISSLIDKFVQFKMLGLHFERLSDITFTKQDPMLSRGKQLSYLPQSSTKYLNGDLDVVNVSFSYSDMEPPIFSNLSFNLTAGSSIAIVGASGSGKTTLLKCLMGLLPIKEGVIKVGGQNIFKIAGYRRNISAVMQEDQLFSGTIKANVSSFAEDIDDDLVIDCCSMVNLDKEISALPMGYNTLIGDLGSNLSGGQKQRLILARALYRKPKILFLDEASSNLDIANEKYINEQLKSLKITRIIVAHRPETINMADSIFDLNDFIVNKNKYQVKSH